MKTVIKGISLYLFIPLLSFIGGFYAYTATLRIVWDQSLGSEADFVLYYGALAFFLVVLPIYLGIIYMIDNRFSQLKMVLYPLGCVLVFFIPTLFIVLLFGSINIFTPEAMLFHSFFITSGLIFGTSTWVIKKIL